MKIVGLITEYNPFHNGHLYHIEKAKELSGADAVIVVMSGNFVQRGAPAIMPKHLRAEAALRCGVSAVFELPVCYATGSAEFFAEGAISLLDSLGCIDSICFGSECGDLKILDEIAKLTTEEPEEYKEVLRALLKEGLSFPKARRAAVNSCMPGRHVGAILDAPNNILGIEYIKALKRRNSSMKIFTIKRIVSGYHDNELKENYSSASAIRNLLYHSGNSVHTVADRPYDEPALTDVLTSLEDQVPPSCIMLMEDNHLERYPVYSDDFSLLFKYRLMTLTKEELSAYMDVSEELANRIKNQLNYFISFDQFCDLLKTKEMTYSRISRSLFHILLKITEKDMTDYRNAGGCQYAHVLGFRKNGSSVLRHIKKHTSIPIITKPTQTEALSECAGRMFDSDIFASLLYESVVTEKFKFPFINEYQNPIVIVK